VNTGKKVLTDASGGKPSEKPKRRKGLAFLRREEKIRTVVSGKVNRKLSREETGEHGDPGRSRRNQGKKKPNSNEKRGGPKTLAAGEGCSLQVTATQVTEQGEESKTALDIVRGKSAGFKYR